MAIVLLSRRLPEPVMQEMVRRFTLIGNLEDRPMTRLELLNQVPEAMMHIAFGGQVISLVLPRRVTVAPRRLFR